MGDFNINDRHYILSENVYLYPSSNASDGGQITSEGNVHNLNALNHGNNFMVKPFGKTFEQAIAENPPFYKNSASELIINPSLSCINGYYVKIGDDTISIEVSPQDVQVTEYIYITLTPSGDGNLNGDQVRPVGSSTVTVCAGCSILLTDTYINKSSDDYKYNLLLGYISVDASGIRDITIDNYNKLLYISIDSSNIFNVFGDFDLSTEIANINSQMGNFIKNVDTLDDVTKLQTIGTKLTVNGNVNLKGSNTLGDSWSADNHSINGNINNVGLFTSNGIDIISHSRSTAHNGHLNVAGQANFNNGIEVNKGSINIKDGNFTVARGATIGTSASASSTTSLYCWNKAIFKSPVTILGSSVTVGENNAKSNITTYGNLTVNGDIRGTRVYNAVWNDLAEWMRKLNDDADYEPGTVICKVKGTDRYGSSTYATRRLVVGVCSDSYGHILGGENLMNMEDNKKKYIPVALCGRVSVKVVQGEVINEGDILYVSKEDGRATNRKYFEDDSVGTVIGKALEDSDGKKDKILMMVMLR